jgi:hypothetical protein
MEGGGRGREVTYIGEFGLNVSQIWEVTAWYSFIYVTEKHANIFLWDSMLQQ